MEDHDKKHEDHEQERVRDAKERMSAAHRKTESKRRGFYTALYSCVGVMLVVALVLSIQSMGIDSTNLEPENATNQAAITNGNTDEELYAVNKGNDLPTYLTPQDRGEIGSSVSGDYETGATNDEAAAKPNITKPSTTKPPTNSSNNSTNSSSNNSSAQSSTQSSINSSAQSSTPTIPNQAKQNVTQEDTQNSTTNSLSNNDSSSDTADEEEVVETSNSSDEPIPLPVEVNDFIGADSSDEADIVEVSEVESPSFTSFADDMKMTWPVVGEILMDFSMDMPILDKTLEHFRTNNNICIGSDMGTQVRASAEGVVSKIYHTIETGNAVTIEHGNGWSTTYGQLQEDILVKVGDVVSSGQLIGSVSSPSIFGSALGSHLNFSVAKNDKPINPNTILD